MSKINELVAMHCPSGVAFVPIGEIAQVGTGSSDRKNATQDGHYPFYVRSKEVMRIDSYEFDEEAILIPGEGGVGEIFHYVHGKYALHQRAYRIHFVDDGVDTKFAYYYFSANFKRFILQKAVSATVTSLRKPMITDFPFPVPPLEIQREIVRILDTFSKMEAELEAELEARKQQYEHYRTDLLTNAAQLGQSVELGDLGRIVTGRTPKSSDSSAWGDHIDFITPSDIKNGMKWIRTPSRRLSVSGAEALSKAIVPQGSLLVTCIGADMGKTVLNKNVCVTNQQINSLTLDPGVDSNFVFHILTSMRDKIRAQGERAGGTMPIINKSDFSKIRIALPSLEEQRRIASTLDQFDALVNDLSIGLPAELAARRQQYEYYRDKLLTFKEAA